MTRITDLMEKDVISLEDGQSLGCVGDAEINVCDQKICSLVIFGRPRLFGIFGREDDTIIKWEDIELIGEDTILVKKCYCPGRQNKRRKKKFF